MTLKALWFRKHHGAFWNTVLLPEQNSHAHRHTAYTIACTWPGFQPSSLSRSNKTSCTETYNTERKEVRRMHVCYQTEDCVCLDYQEGNTIDLGLKRRAGFAITEIGRIMPHVDRVSAKTHRRGVKHRGLHEAPGSLEGLDAAFLFACCLLPSWFLWAVLLVAVGCLLLEAGSLGT